MTTISRQVNQGDSVSIQATPKTGYTFTGWTEDGDSSRVITDNPYTFTPDSDTSIDAIFSEVQPIISWVGSPGNLVIKNRNGQTHNLWSGGGTNKYFGDVEGFGVNDIVSVWISGNDPDGTNTLINHTWLTELNLSGLTNLTLGKRSFAYCTTLTTVVLPNSSYSIESGTSSLSGAFQGCTALSSLTLGTCTSIGNYTFKGCTSLGTVNLPSSCTSIGNNAFNGCTRLRTLNFASTGTALSIGILAFQNCDIRSLEFPSYLTEIVESSYGTCVDIPNTPNKNNACNPFQYNSNLASITMPTESSRYKAEGNCLIDKQYHPNARSGDTGNYYTVIVGCKNSVIPTTAAAPYQIVRAIGAAAFMGNSGLTAITIPERITYIEAYAFYECTNLATITFTPDSGLITNPYLRICGNAFGYCTSLSSITFPSRIKQFGHTYTTGTTYYSTTVFYNCSALRTAHLDSVATPPSIMSGPSFSGENLFPSTIEKIYVKPGTMSAYQSDSKWVYWYNQKKLYTGVNISSSVSPSGSSTVSTSSNSVEFQSDSAAPTVRLTATPTTGYTFSIWKRGSTVLSTSNPYTATVVDNGTGTDEFIALSTVASYSISASINPSGGGTVSGTGTYSYGDSCTVSATASTGYDFVNWTENGTTVSSSASYTFTVSANRTLVANFELETITISAGPNTVGYGTVSGNSGTYSYGDTVSLTATAASGYEFSEWTENGTTVSSNATYSFTATQDRTLVAVFVVATPMRTISVAKSPNSSYSGTPVFTGAGTYPEGTTITISVPESSNYFVNQWYNQSETITVYPYPEDPTNTDTWNKYSLDGHYIDSNSFQYTVGNSDATIYCNLNTSASNELASRYYEPYTDPETGETYPYDLARIPAFDCYDSNDTLLGVWSAGGFGSHQTCPFTLSSVYKLKVHYETVSDEWSTQVVSSDMGLLEYLNVGQLTNLHEIDFLQTNGWDDGEGNIQYSYNPSSCAGNLILPASCKVLKNVSFTYYSSLDQYGNEQKYYPNQINLGNVETLVDVQFMTEYYDINTYPTMPDVYTTQTYWNGYYNSQMGSTQWDISTYKLRTYSTTPDYYLYLFCGTYQTELYAPEYTGTTFITSVNNPYITRVIIPENQTTTTLGRLNGSYTSITIPSNITTLGDNTFNGCSSLASITIPSSVSRINNNVFQDCTSLTSINLSGNTLTNNTLANTFYGCSNLTSVSLPSGITTLSGTFNECSSLASITIPSNITTLSNGDFRSCTSLTSIDLSGTTITTFSNSYNFANCTSLTSITLPSGLTNLGDNTFNGCSSLTSITLPSEITSIGSNAFQNCTSLASITLPSGLTSIGGSAFMSCTSLTSITLPSGLTSIGGGAFNNSGLTSLTLPSSLRTLSNNALRGIKNITTISIPSGITSFGTGIFNGDTSLTSVSGLDSLSITDFTNMFSGCTALVGNYTNPSTGHTVFKVPNGVNNIKGAFYGCAALQGVLLPGNAVSTGTSSSDNGAFRNCTNLEYVEFQNGGYFSGINQYAFYGCAKLKSMPDLSHITTLGQYAFYNCKSIENTTITIPTTITSIPTSAFEGLWNNVEDQIVRTIYVPYTVRQIKQNAFKNVGGAWDHYDEEDWDDDGKPAHSDLYIDIYGPVAIEIGDSTNGSNLYTSGLNALLSGSLCANTFKTNSWYIDSDDLDDESADMTSGGQGYIKFYGSTPPTLVQRSSGSVFQYGNFDLDGTKEYKAKIYVPSTLLSSYQARFNTYGYTNYIDLEGF